jgi:hypothetical protein
MSKLCDECETVAHCLKHGCIPKQALAAPTQPSPCPELIAKHQSTGVPAHIQIKCREYL